MIKQLCIFTIVACTSTSVIAASDKHDSMHMQLRNTDNTEYTPLNRPMTPMIVGQATSKATEGESEPSEEFSAFEEDSEQPIKRQVEQRSDNNIGDRDIEQQWTPEEWYRIY
jgi:hypothetical protein